MFRLTYLLWKKKSNFLEINKSLGTVGTEIKRYCSVECVNYDKPSCTANNWQSLNKQSEIPLKCSSYRQAQAGEGF